MKVATLFRGVPPDVFNRRVKGLFLEIKRAWHDIPFEIVNDGEVTALAGSMSLGDNAVLGIALGSSQAAGYVTPEGNITSWLNELAFAPVDYQPHGAGRRVVARRRVRRAVLLAAGGRTARAARRASSFPKDMPLPEQLKEVQALMAPRRRARGSDLPDDRRRTSATALAHYARFYPAAARARPRPRDDGQRRRSDARTRAQRARKGVSRSWPIELSFHVPDEKNKRHGQAIAAASLPALER